MYRVGLTGNVASGKSAVARVWVGEGADLIDADVLARRAVEPGSPGLERVREVFGEALATAEGLDRAAMRRLVFDDPEARARLEAILHPEVARLRELEEARLREAGAKVVVHDIPLLFEVGLQDEFDLVVLVDAPEAVRAERLVRDRGLDPEEARKLIAAQMPAAEKRGRADVVIENAGTLKALDREARRVWRDVVAPAARLGGREAAPERRLRIDMHVHTRASFDCRSDPDEVVRRAASAGLDRVCITDHNELTVALTMAERYPGHVIPGEEVRTAEGVDVIGLYLTEWIPKGTPARETCERIRDQDGLVYVPHPFAGGKGGGGRILPEIEDLVHVVEGFNARIHNAGLNERAQVWARARELPMGAGSDAHTLGEVGRAYVEVPPFDDGAAGLAAALEDAHLQGRASSRLVHVASTLAKLLP